MRRTSNPSPERGARGEKDIGGVFGSQTGTLVLFPGALGDLACFFPALREIAGCGPRPVSLACRSGLESLVDLTGLARPRSLDARETSWLFSPNPPAEAAAFFGSFDRIESFTGAGDPDVRRNLAGWKGEAARVHPFRPERPIHLALHFLQRLGVAAHELPEFRTTIDPDARARALRRFAATARRPFLLIHPGSGAPAKRWSRSGFRRIARAWIRNRGSAFVVLGPAEVEEIPWWTASNLKTLVSPGLVELAALLAGADVFLGNDSGVSHLAAIAGAQGAVLFGPTDPDLWRPLSPRVKPIRLVPWTGVDELPSDQAVTVVARELDRTVRLFHD